MSEDILELVVADIKVSPVKISLQMNGSIDVSTCCQLIVVVRYVKSKKVEENFCYANHWKLHRKPKTYFT